MEKKFINRIIVFSSLFLAIIFGVFIYFCLYPKKENLGCGTKNTPKVCGNESMSPEMKKGKEIFDSNCAACHKVNAKSTPDLIKNVFERMPSEEYFKLFITNEDSLRKANDKYAKRLKEEFPTGFVHNFKFNDKEIENLKKYINIKTAYNSGLAQ